MKRIQLQIGGLILLLALMVNTNLRGQGSLLNDSILMGSSYANEVYYSMANGQVSAFPRDSWDIAFRPSVVSSAILTNDGTGVVLYTYPNADTSGWNTLDTTGLSSWTPMYNDPGDWENGAFSRNALGHPDYGWGIYNINTHNVKGDSLFVIKLRNESFRKLWIVRKLSSLNTYVFRFAYLDGSNEQEITLDCMPYADKDFVGYNLAMNTVVDFQPPKQDWDLVFTKYMSIQPNGDPYPVTGVLTRWGVGVNKYHPVPLSYSEWSLLPFDAGRSTIGWDWKVFDMGSFSYQTVDSLVYFVQPESGEVYKLIFTAFAGTSTGKVVFGKDVVSAAAIEEQPGDDLLWKVFPNPAADRIMLEFSLPGLTGTSLKVLDISGRCLWERKLDNPAETNLAIPVKHWKRGIYFIYLFTEERVMTRKMLLQ